MLTNVESNAALCPLLAGCSRSPLRRVLLPPSGCCLLIRTDKTPLYRVLRKAVHSTWAPDVDLSLRGWRRTPRFRDSHAYRRTLFLLLLLEPGFANATVAPAAAPGNNQWNKYLPTSGSARFPAGPRQLRWKTKRRSTWLSVALSVLTVAQPGRPGRRSSTFTLPACQTSRAVLVNELAIRYCSVKHFKLAWGGKGRRSDAGIKLLRRKDEFGEDRNADLQRRH